MAQYSKADYWEQRYSENAVPFDFYQRWEGLKDTLVPTLKAGAPILILGSGTSRLSEDLHGDGFTDVTNIDLAESAIEALKQINGEKLKGVKYQQMDARSMSFGPQSFETIIDKACLDAIMTGNDGKDEAQKVLTEVSRVLKPGGVFFMISHADKQYRLDLLQQNEYGWTVRHSSVPKMSDASKSHYIYQCVKS
eukprot:TRINITY_DN42805_c0_g1_i1.p1 TRINITY_DN42805_c0_g1~~TRINITY_DN42805_c0_g1_i1.p1  ORF type:complete len:194 (-),score=29.74 TRINITY_DN42805_c0_g1_i1:246-827(-)